MIEKKFGDISIVVDLEDREVRFYDGDGDIMDDATFPLEQLTAEAEEGIYDLFDEDGDDVITWIAANYPEDEQELAFETGAHMNTFGGTPTCSNCNSEFIAARGTDGVLCCECQI